MYSRRNALQIAGGALLSGLANPAWAVGRRFAIPITRRDARLTCDGQIKGTAIRFALDTGANISLISAPFARRAGLATIGHMTLSVARNLDRYPIVRADRVTLGGNVTIDGIAFAVVEPHVLGSEAEASLSAGAMTLMDSQFDFAAGQWMLYPDGGPSRPDWHAHDRAIVTSPGGGGTDYLFGDVQVGSTLHKLGFDTGAPTPCRLSEQIVSKVYPGWQLLPWSPNFKGGGKVGRTVRLPVPVRIGDLIIERPVVAVSTGAGFFAHGLIGLPLLQRLDMATDVKKRALYTRANGRTEEAPSYNLAGLWIDRQGQAISAGAVGKGSPAEIAGIKPGDPISGMGFDEMIAAFRGPEGRILSLRAGRNQRPVELVLRDYL